MCSSDFSLKLIAAACILIICTDSFVLQQILEKEDFIQLTSEPEIFQTCYKPQIRMRIVFTGYAINSAAVCLVLTLALMCCDEFSELFDKIVHFIAEYMYIAFGPVLLTFCLFGVFSIPQLAYECMPTHVSNNLNLMDILILLICTALSFCIVFIYALQHTSRLAESDLGEEHSIFYQVFSTYLKRARHRYHSEKQRSKQPLNGRNPLTAFLSSARGHDDASNQLQAVAGQAQAQRRDSDDEQPEGRISASSERMPLKLNRSMSQLSQGGTPANRSYTDLRQDGHEEHGAHLNDVSFDMASARPHNVSVDIRSSSHRRHI